MRAFVELMTISGETFPTTLATIICGEKSVLAQLSANLRSICQLAISKLNLVGITDILVFTT